MWQPWQIKFLQSSSFIFLLKVSILQLDKFFLWNMWCLENPGIFFICLSQPYKLRNVHFKKHLNFYSVTDFISRKIFFMTLENKNLWHFLDNSFILSMFLFILRNSRAKTRNSRKKSFNVTKPQFVFKFQFVFIILNLNFNLKVRQ